MASSNFEPGKIRLTKQKKSLKLKITNLFIFTSFGTTRGQGIIRVVVALVVVTFFSDIHIFWNIFKVNKAQILVVMSVHWCLYEFIVYPIA